MGVSKTQVVKFIRKGDTGDPAVVYEIVTNIDMLRPIDTDVQVTIRVIEGNKVTIIDLTKLSTYGLTIKASINSVDISGLIELTSDSQIYGFSVSKNDILHIYLYKNGTLVAQKHLATVANGEKGEQGATLRGPQAWSDCATGYAFKAGGASEQWKDVVLYNGNYYSCVKSHTKTASNYPGSTTATNNGYWQLGDKIELVATKILLATYALVENLGVTAIDMKDAAGNILFQAKDGNVACKTGTFENVTVSGTLKGVTGSFKSLNCIDDSGKVVCNMSFGSDGRMWFNNGDIYQQGTKDNRTLRFYASDIWCRGDFGAATRNVLVVHGSYGYYYTKGVTGSGTYVSFTSAKDSNNNTYYTIPMYGGNGDCAGFPVDIVVFKITSDTVYNFLLSMSNSQRVLLINANDDKNNAKVYSNGSLTTIAGGVMREVCKMYTFQYPQQDSTVLGAGLFMGAANDNNW